MIIWFNLNSSSFTKLFYTSLTKSFASGGAHHNGHHVDGKNNHSSHDNHGNHGHHHEETRDYHSKHFDRISYNKVLETGEREK